MKPRWVPYPFVFAEGRQAVLADGSIAALVPLTGEPVKAWRVMVDRAALGTIEGTLAEAIPAAGELLERREKGAA